MVNVTQLKLIQLNSSFSLRIVTAIHSFVIRTSNFGAAAEPSYYFFGDLSLKTVFQHVLKFVWYTKVSSTTNDGFLPYINHAI